jgi:hypothetical protein
MKKKIAVLTLVLLALWLGYALGYHQGIRNEREAWASAYTVDSSGKPIYSTWPHSRRVVRLSNAVNVPDPRNTPVR